MDIRAWTGRCDVEETTLSEYVGKRATGEVTGRLTELLHSKGILSLDEVAEVVNPDDPDRLEPLDEEEPF